MNDTETTVPAEAVPEVAPTTEAAPAAVPAEVAPVQHENMRDRRGGRGGGREGGRGPRRGQGRERSEFDSVTIAVRRVARVMAGGRRFNFSVSIVIGDKKGRVGVGLGKAADTALAIEKATRDAKKHMITVKRTENNSIAHDVSAKYASSTIAIMPSTGRGLVAGSAMRTVLELAGVTDVITKILSRTKNKLTIARATVEALKSLNS